MLDRWTTLGVVIQVPAEIDRGTFFQDMVRVDPVSHARIVERRRIRKGLDGETAAFWDRWNGVGMQPWTVVE